MEIGKRESLLHPGCCASFRPLLAMVLLVSILWGCAHQSNQIHNKENGIPVRFIYADATAGNVCIAGSFNQWAPQSHCMARDGKGWSLVVSLPPGRYQYVFVIDGNIWNCDPGAVISEETEFGTKNSVLIVE